MAIIFPDDPLRLDTTFTGGQTWQWDGYRWNPFPEIGYVGSTGSLGGTGYLGSAGNTGYQGSVGYQSSVGYTGSVGVAAFQNTVPSSLVPGQLWFDTDDGYMSAYFDSENTWIGINGGTAGYQGSTGYTGSLGYAGSLGYSGSKGDIGYVGSRGDVGYTGSYGYVGSKGEYGGASYYYYFNNDVNPSTNPSSGYIKLNNINTSLATSLKINFYDTISNISPFLDSLYGDLVTYNRAYVTISERYNKSNYVVFAINGTKDIGETYFNMTIAYVGGNGGVGTFANNVELVLSFTKNGLVGYTGSKGILDKEATLSFSNTITFSNNIIVNNAFIATSLDIINYSEAIKNHGTVTGPTTIYLANGNIQYMTLGASPIVLTFSNTGMQDNRGYNLTLVVTQDNFGPRLLSYNTANPVKWSFGSAPILSTTAQATDILTFFTGNKGASWYGTLTGKSFS